MLLLASLGCTPASTRSASHIHDSTREWQNPFLRASVEAVVRLVTLSLFILRYDLLGTLRRAGIGKIADGLAVLAYNVDDLVVMLMRDAVGLNPDHIGIPNQIRIG